MFNGLDFFGLDEHFGKLCPIKAGVYQCQPYLLNPLMSWKHLYINKQTSKQANNQISFYGNVRANFLSIVEYVVLISSFSRIPIQNDVKTLKNFG